MFGIGFGMMDVSVIGGVGRPSLSLQFTGSSALDPRITFTRSSIGTYFDSAGLLQTASSNAPRFDYNPSTLAPAGLLIEESRTNLLLNSATLGTQNVTTTAVAHTLSFYGTGSVTLSGTATGTLNGSGAFPTRSTLTFTPTAGTLTLTVTGSVTFANLEAGSFATTYIPTAGTTVTRAADVASMTGTNFSGWFNASAGTFFAEFDSTGSTTSGVYAANDNTANNRIDVRFNQGAFKITNPVTVGGAQQYLAQSGTAVSGAVVKCSMAFAAASFNTFADGARIGTAGTSGTVPTVNQLRIGAIDAGTSPLNGHIRRLSFYPRALSNAELQSITT